MSSLRDLRNRVVDREDRCCLRCGKWAEGGSLHHRKLRSQGGQDSLENLVLLCGSGSTGCHGWAHENRAEARESGLIVAGWDDTASEPLVVYGHGWVLLDPTRPGYLPLSPERGAA